MMRKVHSRRKLPHVAIIDDSLFDITLLKRALKNAEGGLKISSFTTGQDILSHFFGPSSSETTKPDVCFLDLNMPGLSGLDVLKKMKTDDSTRHIPVFVFSTSDLYSDISASYRAGANGYLVKANKKDDLEEMARAFLTLWLGPYRFLD